MKCPNVHLMDTIFPYPHWLVRTFFGTVGSDLAAPELRSKAGHAACFISGTSGLQIERRKEPGDACDTPRAVIACLQRGLPRLCGKIRDRTANTGYQ